MHKAEVGPHLYRSQKWANLYTGSHLDEPYKPDESPTSFLKLWVYCRTARECYRFLYPRSQPPIQTPSPARHPATNLRWRAPARSLSLFFLIYNIITQKSRVAGPLPLAGLEARGGRDISGQLGILIFNITQPAPDTSSSTKHPRPLYMAGPIDTTRRANAAAHAPVPFTYLSHKQYYYLARR